MLTQNWNGVGKQIARIAATARRNDKQAPAKVALFLPGNECLCVRSALEQGIIDENTHIIAVERNKDTAKVIESQLETLVHYFDIHVGPITTLDFSEFGIGKGELEFAFFDFCGSLELDLVQWLLYQSSVFSTNAQVAFTFCTLGRSNLFIKNVLWELDECKSVNKNMIGKWAGVTRSIDKGLRNHTRLIYGSDNKYRVANISAAWAILSSNYKVKIDCCEEYRDSSPMIMVKFNIVELGNVRSENVRDFLLTCSDGCLDFDENIQAKAKANVEIESSKSPWELINCPSDWTPVDKAMAVKNAKNGIRPSHLSPQKWAWNIINPNGIRRNK